MRICIDLDGTICSLRQSGQSYADVEPKPGAKEMIEALRRRGHTIIIHTARNMQTQDHNVGRVMRTVGRDTLEWLDRHGIQYDEIFFGKPNASVIIDDRAIRFEDWSLLSEEVLLAYTKKR